MIDINQDAIDKLNSLLAEEQDPDLFLRIFVEGGGCSGFRYGFIFDKEKQADDFLIEKQGIKMLVDSMSSQYLNGATIEYNKSGLGGSFSIKNPNAKASCGCGSSFAI